MGRASIAILTALALLCLAVAAWGNTIAFKNQTDDDLKVAVFDPCTPGHYEIMVVKSGKVFDYRMPPCPAGKNRSGGVPLAVLGPAGNSGESNLDIAIAGKTLVEPPAEAIITYKDCEECDTRYYMQWIPLPAGKN